MRLPLFFLLAATGAAGVATEATAQRTRIYTPLPSTARALSFGSEDGPRAALGITTAASASGRDTLGLLVSSIIPNSPAERAGIEEGNRLASINGVNLKVAAVDAGDWEMGNAMSRRLTRELGRVRPGDEVELRVYSSGQTRTVRVKTVDSDSLYGRRRFSRSEDDDRATLGLSIGATNSRRDTLGVLVMFVDDSGPAAKAGIEEGNRIAAIKDTDLRMSREDAGDDFVASAKVRRLQREIANLRPGDEVELRVYANGRFRNVTLRAARASDLPRQRRSLIITGDRMGLLNGFPEMGIDGHAIGGEVRRALERAMEASGRALEDVGRGFGRRFDWHDDMHDDHDELERAKIEPLEPTRIEPLAPSRARPTTSVRPTMRSALYVDSVAPAVTTAEFVSSDFDRPTSDGGSVAVNIAGLRLVPVGQSLATYLGRGSERGLLVIDVPRWAEDVLDAGDVVLRIDGRAVREGAGLENVTVDLPRFRDATLDVMRDGQVRTVRLPARR